MDVGGWMSVPFLSGSEITDSIRRIAREGDGLEPDQGSVGIWETTTNLIANGGFETDTTGWIALAAGSSIARSTTRSKFGSASLRVVCDGTLIDQGCFGTPYTTIAAVTIYTASVWVYVESGATSLRLVIDEFLTNVYVGTTVYQSVTGVRGEWVRLTATWTSEAAINQAALSVRNVAAEATTFHVDGIQIEQKPIATPYVETNGTTASRTSSRAFVTLPSSLFTTTQGWVAARVRMGWNALPGANAMVWSWGDDNNNRLILYFTTATTDLWATRSNGGAGNFVNLTVPAAEVGTMRTLIMAWTAAAVKIAAGGAFTSVANNDIPTLANSVMDIGSSAWIGTPQYLDSDFNWFATGTGTLTDADAIRIASFNNDPVVGNFPGSPTWFWNPNNAPGVTNAIPHTSSGVAW